MWKIFVSERIFFSFLNTNGFLQFIDIIHIIINIVVEAASLYVYFDWQPRRTPQTPDVYARWSIVQSMAVASLHALALHIYTCLYANNDNNDITISQMD